MERFHQLKNNEKRLAESDWDNLYLPSIFFGYFLRERVTALLESAVKKNFWIINY
jgi:uncharacterized NAD(P)/FAD-binding protein YdhS